MVEIEGERVLAASCVRQPTPGMKVQTASERAEFSRKMVFELLIGDQPDRAAAHDPSSRFWQWADKLGVSESRFPRRAPPAPDRSHPAMAVQLDACIECTLCVRACREVQVNDVIGMAARNWHEKIIFDFDDPMGASTCVACGECVQACPTGALMPASLVDANGVYANAPDREVESVCPYCGVGCQLTYRIRDDRIVAVDGRDGPANHNRLCVKGRFGFDYVAHPDRLTEPLIRREGVSKHDVEIDPANPFTHFRKASWEEALDLRCGRAEAHPRPRACPREGGAARRVRLGQGLERGGLSLPEAGPHRVRQQQCRSLHAAVPRLLGRRTDGRDRLGRGHRAVHRGGRCRRHHHHRRAPDRQPSGRRDLLQAGGKTRRQADRDGPARPGHGALCDPHAALQAGARCRNAERAAAHDHRGGSLRQAVRPGAYARISRNCASTSRAYSPEAMAEICGVDAATLRHIARTYARAEAAIIFWGMGISQHVHGTDNARCLIALALVTGQIGRPGTGLHPLRGQNNVQGASDAGLIPMVYPDYQVGRATRRSARASRRCGRPSSTTSAG